MKLMGRGASENLSNPFAALKHKDFRYYWIGMCISLIGTWMQNIAQPWLAYTLTKSPLLLSLIGTLQFTPVLLFSLFAGVVIDRFPKRKILVLTQSASMLITLILGILVYTGHVKYYHIVIMAVLQGFVNTLDMPARQSFVIELVGKEDLMNAVALNSSVFNMARIVGPAVAGVLMGYVGIAFCFLGNSLSYAAVVISLVFFIRPKYSGRAASKSDGVFRNIKEGLKYVFSNDTLLNVIVGMLIVGTFVPNFSVLVPVFDKEVLKQGEAGFGFLMSIMGAGSFVGSMIIATTSRKGPWKFILNTVPFILAALLILTGMTRVYVLTGICMAFMGFFFVSFTSTSNSTMQLNARDEFRGRAMSVYTLVFAGSTPIGNLFAGVVSNRFGAGVGFVACGIAVAVLLVFLHMFRRLRKPSAQEDEVQGAEVTS